MQPPGLPLGGLHQPRFPLAVPIGLTPEELQPREGARVLDRLRRGVHQGVDAAQQVVVELEEEQTLVALCGPVTVVHAAQAGWPTSWAKRSPRDSTKLLARRADFAA